MKNKYCRRFLVTTTFSVLMALSPSLGMDSNLDEPKFGSGSIDKKNHNFVPENKQLLENIRTFHRQHGSDAKTMSNPLLIPHVQYLLKHMLTVEGQNIKKLQMEVEERIKNGDVSALWLHFTHFRFLALISDENKTKIEMELFEHTPSDPLWFKAFFKKMRKVMSRFCLIMRHSWIMS